MSEHYHQDLVRSLAELRERTEAVGVPLTCALAVLRFITARSHVARPALRRRFHLTAPQIAAISWFACDHALATLHFGPGPGQTPPGRRVLCAWPFGFSHVLALSALAEASA